MNRSNILKVVSKVYLDRKMIINHKKCRYKMKSTKLYGKATKTNSFFALKWEVSIQQY
jgi:hypothetical protein